MNVCSRTILNAVHKNKTWLINNYETKAGERRRKLRDSAGRRGRADHRHRGLARAKGARPCRRGRLRGRRDLQRGRRPRRAPFSRSTRAPWRPLEEKLTAAGARAPPSRPERTTPSQPAGAACACLYGFRRGPTGCAGAQCSTISRPPRGTRCRTGISPSQMRLFSYVEEPLKVLQPGMPAARLALIARSLVSAVHGIVVLGLEEKLQLIPSRCCASRSRCSPPRWGRGLFAATRKPASLSPPCVSRTRDTPWSRPPKRRWSDHSATQCAPARGRANGRAHRPAAAARWRRRQPARRGRRRRPCRLCTKPPAPPTAIAVVSSVLA